MPPPLRLVFVCCPLVAPLRPVMRRLAIVAGPAERLEIRAIEAPLGRVADRLDVIDGLGSALDAALRAVSAERFLFKRRLAQLAPIGVIAAHGRGGLRVMMRITGAPQGEAIRPTECPRRAE